MFLFLLSFVKLTKSTFYHSELWQQYTVLKMENQTIKVKLTTLEVFNFTVLILAVCCYWGSSIIISIMSTVDSVIEKCSSESLRITFSNVLYCPASYQRGIGGGSFFFFTKKLDTPTVK